MSVPDRQLSLVRRSFLSRIATGVTAFGAIFAARTSAQETPSGGNQPWRARRHPQDEWLDRIPGDHRLVFDATTPDGLKKAMRYANNYFVASQDAYGLKDSDLAVVIVVRHNATPLAYNDAMWSKYGTSLSRLTNVADPSTKQPPSANPYRTGGEASLEILSGRGVQFAVCEMATQVFARGIARGGAGDADAIHKELISNLVRNSRPVAAGIVAVNRAQERGYSLADAG